MQQNKTWKKRVAICGLLPAMLGTAILGCGLLSTNAPVSVVAEDTTSTSHTYTLAEQIGKVGYTDEEYNAALGDDETLSLAEKKALYQTAFAKSDLKYYAGAHTGGDGTYYQVMEYATWADHSNKWKWSGTAINGLCVGNNFWGNELNTFDTDGTHYIFSGRGSTTTEYNQFYSIAWTAPANGVLTIPQTTLTINSFTNNATLKMAVTTGNYLKPIQSGWTEYTEAKEYTIASQRYKVEKDDVIYMNFYAEGTTLARGVNITYNPTFQFLDAVDDPYKSTSTTLVSEIGKVSWTEEEKTASGWNGSSRDANKVALYKTAFGKSDLRFYVGAGANASNTGYKVYESWDWVGDGSGYFINYLGVNGYQFWNAFANTEYQLRSTGSHGIGGSNLNYPSWMICWTAPSNGVLTIPEHTLTVSSFTKSTAFNLAWTADTYLTPFDASSTWTTYTATGDYTIEKQTFAVSAGDTVYLNMYSQMSQTASRTDIVYNPTFEFTPTVGEVVGNTVTAEEDLGLNFYVDIANADSATATMQMDGEAAETVDGVYDEAKALWRFTYPVAAKDYDKTVNFVLTSVNGEAVTTGVTDSYSVKAYTEAIAAGEYSESAKTLAASIATYCESAKVYFDETAAALAEKVTGEVVAKADLTASKASLTGESDGNVTAVLGATLALEYKTMIHVYFTATDVSAIVGAEAVAGADSLYVLKVAVVAKDLGKAQTITIGGYTLTYSAYSYIEATVDNADAALYNVLQALYDYSENAKAYLG